jgi:hypothetical protein
MSDPLIIRDVCEELKEDIRIVVHWRIPLHGAVNSLFGSYLVDPASGHMLVSKIKPCMSEQKLYYSKAANSSLQQPLFLGSL